MSPERATTTRIYMSPVIFHFTTILLVSLLVPSHPRERHGLLVGLNAVIGVVASIIICTRKLMRANADSAVDWTNRLAYGAAPVFAYAGALVAAVLIFLGRDTGLTFWQPQSFCSYNSQHQKCVGHYTRDGPSPQWLPVTSLAKVMRYITQATGRTST